MTTKRIVIVIGSVVVALGLLIAAFVGGIALFVFYQVGHSDAASQARIFLKSKERLKPGHWRRERFRLVCDGKHQRSEWKRHGVSQSESDRREKDRQRHRRIDVSKWTTVACDGRLLYKRSRR